MEYESFKDNVVQLGKTRDEFVKSLQFLLLASEIYIVQKLRSLKYASLQHYFILYMYKGTRLYMYMYKDALTHCSQELYVQFSSQQRFWELTEKPTDSRCHCVYTEAIQTSILWIYDEVGNSVISF